MLLPPSFRRAFVLCSLVAHPLAVSALDTRVANTTLTVPDEPPIYGYQTVNAFGNLTFTRPVAIVPQPGEPNRLFVVEQAGVIYVITNLANPTKTLFMDISGPVDSSDNEEGLLGMAFHPDWINTGHFFLYYTLDTTVNGVAGRYDRLARYEIDPANPNAGLPGSELPLISQLDQDANHNAGDVHFGPDGYLYYSTGDEGGSGDGRNNSRFINKDFFSAILRLDVDRKAASLSPNPHPSVHTNAQGQAYYAIPNDNPFIGATAFNGSSIDPATVRTEFWAVGLRNPWRFSFDGATGRIYCGDVGQGLWEEVDIMVKGGDYGWRLREGAHPYNNNTVPGGVTLIDPIAEYPHSGGPTIPGPVGSIAEGNSITGGVVYNGDRFSQLKGCYIFGDAGFGRIYALRYDPVTGAAQNLQQLLTASQPVAFGIDPTNGDVLIAQLSGQVRRLIYSASPTQGLPLPALLSQTGAFDDLATLAPEAGIVPYDLNLPFWSDYAIKSRWFSIPDVNDTMTFNSSGNWSFPNGTVWIKHFEFEFTNGIPESRRRLETRFLVKNDNGVHGFTYRWNAAQTDANLVSEGGQDEMLAIHNPNGTLLREQLWRYPSRNECLQCHTPAGGHALGFNTVQLNRARDYGDGPTNQIAVLSKVGYFDAAVNEIHALPALSRPDETSVSLERRVRSYLQANCVQCHQPGGLAQGNWDARIATATDLAGLIEGALVNNLGDPLNRVLASGDAVHSVLLQKLSTRGPGQMPPLASSIADPAGVALLAEWINALPDRRTFADWQVTVFGSTSDPNAAAEFDFDGDGASNYLEWLTGTDAENPGSVWRIGVGVAGESIGIEFEKLADRGFEVQFKTTLDPAAVWQVLDVPSNQPGFGSASAAAVVTDPVTGAPSRYYRVRVFQQ